MKKNTVYILSAVTIIASVCYYLYIVNSNYDGGLIDSLVPFLFTMPIIAGVSLWNILTGKPQTPPSQKLWQKIVTVLVYIIAVAAMTYFLIDSDFYDLSSVILAILLLTLIPCAYFDYKKGGKIFKNPVLNWAVVMSGLYVLIFGIVFTYIQIVSPITVEQATDLVASEYGQDAYKFVGYFDYREGNNNLGVYWFAQRYDELDGWVEVDLHTGEVTVI